MLNLQGKVEMVKGKPRVTGGIEWVKTRLPDGSERQGFTANPVRGCQHGCRWIIDGKEVICYAEAGVERYRPGTFVQHQWHPEVLDEIVRKLADAEPCRVFIDSASDLFGAWVNRSQVWSVLTTISRLPHITFMSLTKNAPRLLKFRDDLPDNLWVGVSMPPDVFKDHTLTPNQKEKMLHVALDMLEQIPLMLNTFCSFEPLSWDVSKIVNEHPDALNWAIIGAASRGRVYYQPQLEHLDALESVLHDFSVPVFYKGNLKRLPRREEFPD
jgi:protein gp37